MKPTAEELTAALPFELAGLPATINADMRVDVHAADLNLTIWRRLMRAPPPTTGAVVQVDHSTMALRVDGDVFQGSGWFVAVPDWPPTHWLACTQPPINRTGCVSLWLATMRPRTALGTLSLMMPYRLWTLHPTAQLAFLDACATLGVRIMYPMVELGMSALGGMNYDTDWASPAWRAHVDSNVTLVRNHSAVLGFCEPLAKPSWLHRPFHLNVFLFGSQMCATTAARSAPTSATSASRPSYTTTSSRSHRTSSSSEPSSAPRPGSESHAFPSPCASRAASLTRVVAGGRTSRARRPYLMPLRRMGRR